MKRYIVPNIRTVEIGDVMSGLDIVSDPTGAEQLVNETNFEPEEETISTSKSVDRKSVV